MIVEQERATTLNREIGRIFHSYQQPTALFIGGIHGNEQTGIEAIHHVFKEIEEKNIPVHGNIIGVRGNLKAIEQNERYISNDLNRAFTEENLQHISSQDQNNLQAEDEEVVVLKSILDQVIEKSKAPVLFMDLHTTSSYSSPFTIIDDTLRNRNASNALPVTKVLGISEKIHGTVLSYYGDKGPVSVVFEAGQHFERSSIDRHIAAIWLSLIKFGIIQKESINYKYQYQLLQEAAKKAPKIVETFMRFALNDEDSFHMKAGYSNFKKVKQGEVLAVHNGKEITSPENCMVFMPLYQDQGQDGFFLVNPISRFWISFSRLLRQQKMDQVITVFPGIKKSTSQENTYVVNTKIASFRALDLLHLLGFRKKFSEDHLLYVSRLPYDLEGPWGD